MDLGALIRSFSTGTYSVTRRAAGGFDRGVAKGTTDSTVSVVAAVQPASGRDLLRLPEGRRSTDTRVLFTVTPLLVGDAGATYEANLVTIDGAEWEVQHVEKWTQAGAVGVAYRCIVQAASPT